MGKMKEKKARQQVAKSDVENNNRVDDGLAMGQTEEAPNRVKKKGKKEKKKKKKHLDADGNAENDAPLETSEKPKKKKKKSEAEQQRQSESTGVEDSVPTGPAET